MRLFSSQVRKPALAGPVGRVAVQPNLIRKFFSESAQVNVL